jgi:uncharacterized membrane protein
MVLATATPNPIALAPSDSDRPQPSLGEERNSKTSQQQAETRRSEQVQRFISYGLVLVILTLFLVVPIGLLAIGGLTWWFRRHR